MVGSQRRQERGDSGGSDEHLYVVGDSRISSATRLPTVLDWNSHQSQQRDGDAIHHRSRDVRETYSTEHLTRKRYLLRQYYVNYVILSDVERHTLMPESPGNAGRIYYTRAFGQEAFDPMVGGDLVIVVEAEGTRIVRVNEFVDAGQGT